ncbi:MAG: hypothetical protein ABWY63_14275 [Hyphomicrobiaceae bacterium]
MYSVDPNDSHIVLYKLDDEGNQIVLCRSLRFAANVARDLNRLVTLENFIREAILGNDDIPVEVEAMLLDILGEDPL